MKKAFTLSELLIALTIVGVIAVLTVPNVIKNAYQRTYVAALQTTYNQLSNALNEAMLKQGITDVIDFDFPLEGDDDTQVHEFMKTYLDIQKDCGNSITGCFAPSYKDIDEGRSRSDMIQSGNYAILKNGVALGIEEDFEKNVYIDVNNIDPPNVMGRDFFPLHITSDGQLTTKDLYKMEVLGDMARDCSSFDGYFYTCFDYLQQNNWKMDY